MGRTADLYRAFVQGRNEGYRLEKRYLRKDGEIVWGDTSVSAILGRDGEYQVTVGVIADITKRRESEEAARRLATAVEQAAETIVITDTEGTITYVNPAFERTTGYSREEAIGKNPRILQSGRHGREYYRSMWETLHSGRVWSGHFINKKKDGALFEEEATISPIKDDSGAVVSYVGVKRDVTKEVSLQKQLLQAQKLEAIGTLAGGIAHDFNNLLQVMLGYSELLLSERAENDREYGDLNKIQHAALSGADLVQRLLTFSRKVEPKPVPMSVNHQIRHVAKLLSRTIPKMIDIRLELEPDTRRISADPALIEQVLMNLALNARDAMADGGVLTVVTRNVTLDEEYCDLHPDAKPGSYVLLAVSDTGHGMDEETIEHVFEPFYTTKELGRGTGLGLAMVYGIVKQHGGYITCESSVGTGTTFEIYMPAILAEAEPDTQPDMAAIPTGSETVLLVDDEEIIRDLGKRILERSGYKVLTAANGREALNLYGQQKGEISLVILDLIMPEMGGKQCLEELVKIDPKTKILIASGYSEDAQTTETFESKVRGFIAKPYNLKEMLQTVRKVLDES
jgi:PAS domain S-box-containing protein